MRHLSPQTCRDEIFPGWFSFYYAWYPIPGGTFQRKVFEKKELSLDFSFSARWRRLSGFFFALL
jgi:hypothetical protein